MKVSGKDKLRLTGHDWNIKILCPSSYDGGGGGGGGGRRG